MRWKINIPLSPSWRCQGAENNECIRYPQETQDCDHPTFSDTTRCVSAISAICSASSIWKAAGNYVWQPRGANDNLTLQLKALQPKRRCEEAPIKGSQNTKPMGVSQIAVPLLTIGFPIEKQPINWIMYRVGPSVISVPFQKLLNGGLGLPLLTTYCLATCA